MNIEEFPKKVKIIEVGPRDGLQNEKKILKTEDKVTFIKELAMSGLSVIEATSFVRADKIPQMADASALFKSVNDLKGVDLPCLVPNIRGLEAALECGVREIAVFTATSESFNQKNINSSIDEGLSRLVPVFKMALENKLKIRAYVSTAFGCPYEGETSLSELTRLSDWMLEKGAYEVSIGDTIGSGTPGQVGRYLDSLLKTIDKKHLALHFHDTRGMAKANTLMALSRGISSFDSSAGGLGGCPYAKGATGNVATESLVYLFNSLGIETGVDLEKVVSAGQKVLGLLGKKNLDPFLNAYLNANVQFQGPFS